MPDFVTREQLEEAATQIGNGIKNTVAGMFLPNPDRVDEDGESYFYFGWANVNGDWLIQRQNRTTGQSASATPEGNPSHTDLDAAWAVRANLSYTTGN